MSEQRADLLVLANLTTQVGQLDIRIAKGTQLLKDLSDLRTKLLETDIPQAMESLDLQEYVTTDGAKVKVKERIHAHISEANKPEAFKWLRKHKFASLIKTELSVVFGKGEDALARKAAALLGKSFKGHRPEVSETVNHNTLKAFVREQLEAGNDLPMELLGVHRQTIAEFELPKAKELK